MSETQTSFAGLRPVELDAVERELDHLWRDANLQIASTAGHAIARNSVLTLVTVTTTEAEAQQLQGLIHSLSAQHPSRAIVVAADASKADEGITGYIGTYTGQGNSYGEDIVLSAGGASVSHLPGVVLPLIVSGLPSFLWWTSEPPWGSELLEAMVDGCDRFIIDTSEMSNVAHSIRSLDDLMRRKSARCAISDISWTAQAPWRDIVAQFFDSVVVRPFIYNVERLTIEYAAGDEYMPSNSSQAYLFAGWLASRLGWHIRLAQPTPGDGSMQHTLHDASGRIVALEVNARYGIPQQGGLIQFEKEERDEGVFVRPGALMSIYIAARIDGQLGTFAVARERDLEHATTACQVPQASMPSQTIHLASVGETDPLAQQLGNLGHDSVYEEALAATALMMGASSSRRGIS
ncbi:MAG: hypothetical protein OJF49_004830 [Ktedonobacterales bacterium]|nr:MAG: hypothetical protein OJF49_004830 [Ktedonobacterales bacterium]